MKANEKPTAQAFSQLVRFTFTILNLTNPQGLVWQHGLWNHGFRGFWAQTTKIKTKPCFATKIWFSKPWFERPQSP